MLITTVHLIHQTHFNTCINTYDWINNYPALTCVFLGSLGNSDSVAYLGSPKGGGQRGRPKGEAKGGGQRGRPKGEAKGEAKGKAKGEAKGGGQRGRPKGRPKGEAKGGGQRGGQRGRPKGGGPSLVTHAIM